MIPLNYRVPISIAMPAQLPFHNVVQGQTNTYVADPCPLSFAGRIVGYAVGTRSQANVTVTRQLNSLNGNVYRTDYSASAMFGDLSADLVQAIFNSVGFGSVGSALAGIIRQDTEEHLLERGDSGGPLFQGNTVCGINSSDGANLEATVAQFCFINFLGIEVCEDLCDPLMHTICAYDIKLTASNRHARVDSNGVVAWLNTVQPPIYDSRHNVFGTCSPSAPALPIDPIDDKDSDGDMIPDGCDPCPFAPDSDLPGRRPSELGHCGRRFGRGWRARRV